MRELWLQIIRTSGSRMYSLTAGVIVLSITARWLGPAGRGEMSAALVWATLFYIALFFSLNLVAIHELATQFDRGRLGRTLANLVAAAVVGTTVGWLIAAVLYLIRPQIFGAVRGSVLAVALLMLPFLIWEQYGSALLLSIGRLDVFNRANVIAKTLVLALVVSFFVLGRGIHFAVAAMVIGQALLALTGTPLILREARSSIAFDAAMLKRMLMSALKLHPSAVATYVAAYAGVLIVNHYMGNVATGHFQLAAQLIEVMLVVPYAANLVIYSRMGEFGVHNIWPYQRRIVTGTLLLMSAAAVVAAILAPWLIALLAGKAFLPSARIFRWLLFGAVTGTLTAVMTTQWIGRGLFIQISLVNITSVVVALVLNFLLTPRIGMNGAIIASVASYAVTAAANGAMAVRCESEWRARLAADVIEPAQP